MKTNALKRLSPLVLSLISSFAFAQGASTANTLALPSKAKDTKLTLTPGLLGRSMEDQFANSKYAGGTVNVSGSRKFGHVFTANLDVDFLLMAGSFTNQYTDEGKAPNALILNQAYVGAEITKSLTIDAGVIATSFSALPSLWEANGFPSLRETLTLDNSLFDASLFAMQSIPTSDTRTVKSTENGLNTSLNTFGLILGFGENKKAGLGLQTGLTRYQFQNLNSSAATDSQYLGNTVVAPGPQAKFKYEYAGLESAAMLRYQTQQKTTLSLSGAYIKNDQAPTDFNKGYSYAIAIETPINDVMVSASAGYFYNEADTLPAAYSLGARGYNNRFGQRAKIGFKNLRDDVSGFIQYTKANEIEDKAFTADRNFIVFVLEVPYEVL
jgi:hypothetical protein